MQILIFAFTGLFFFYSLESFVRIPKKKERKKKGIYSHLSWMFITRAKANMFPFGGKGSPFVEKRASCGILFGCFYVTNVSLTTSCTHSKVSKSEWTWNYPGSNPMIYIITRQYYTCHFLRRLTSNVDNWSFLICEANSKELFDKKLYKQTNKIMEGRRKKSGGKETAMGTRTNEDTHSFSSLLLCLQASSHLNGRKSKTT